MTQLDLTTKRTIPAMIAHDRYTEYLSKLIFKTPPVPSLFQVSAFSVSAFFFVAHDIANCPGKPAAKS